jgi:ParB family transcriptional regulator, chromosome partitioning protein
MKKSSELIVHEIDCESIKVFVGRARAAEPFSRLIESMAETGLHVPIQVRDITDWPAKERQRPGGGHYRYELICGQGRLEAARQLGWKRIPALLIEADEAEIVGRFLAENMIRKALPWAQKARLMKGDLDAGLSNKDVARKFFVTPPHVEKCRRVLAKTAIGLEDAVASMPLNAAEILTTLPAEDQGIVVEVLREGVGEGNVRTLVAKARALKQETGSLSAVALKKSLERVDDDIGRVRERLKVTRLHHALGPGNLRALLTSSKLRSALKSSGVSLAKFEGVAR